MSDFNADLMESIIMRYYHKSQLFWPIPFSINDLFLFLNKIAVCNFADDTTPFVCRKLHAEIIQKLEKISELAIHCFEGSYTELNTDKCHLLISGHKYEHQWALIDKNIV